MSYGGTKKLELQTNITKPRTPGAFLYTVVEINFIKSP